MSFTLKCHNIKINAKTFPAVYGTFKCKAFDMTNAPEIEISISEHSVFPSVYIWVKQ